MYISLNMNNLILLFTVILFIKSSAQTESLFVEYAVKSESGKVGTGNYLVIQNGLSLYGRLLNNGDTSSNIAGLYDVRRKSKPYTYKSSEGIFSNDFVENQEFVIKDAVRDFDWKLSDDHVIDILGYPCKKAETDFRGRHYIAYYTENIKDSNGPWKFSGLPGLILKVYSIDHYISYEAIKIYKDKYEPIQYPFDANLNRISFSDFKAEYKSVYDRITAPRKTASGAEVRIEMAKARKEKYID